MVYPPFTMCGAEQMWPSPDTYGALQCGGLNGETVDYDNSQVCKVWTTGEDSVVSAPWPDEQVGVPPLAWANVHTVMMRNLPNKYTQRMLLSEINNIGFLGKYDFLYLPIDPETVVNKGYAFVNLTSPASAWMFKIIHEGRKMEHFNSNKVVSVVPAALQGYEANYAHYSSARVSRGDPLARPLFLREQDPYTVGEQKRSRKRGDLAKKGSRKRDPMVIDSSRHDAQQPLQSPQQEKRGPKFSQDAQTTGPDSLETLGKVAGRAAPMQLRFCPYCGGKCEPTFKFCQFCGSSLSGL